MRLIKCATAVFQDLEKIKKKYLGKLDQAFNFDDELIGFVFIKFSVKLIQLSKTLRRIFGGKYLLLFSII